MRRRRDRRGVIVSANSIRSKGNIAEWLQKDPQVTAAVIEQRLRPLG
jgi:hypothetical protein